ncbi:putative outer membrane starch-binding protein [Chitinophaga niastensis]|uniref:Putative outer membrane starch-binding protein n=1 Tax=Chitinophaga niastensis TaxID=536980 RepID=A0A2P8HNV0_CHINA|nr:RagB/SusD family nutrient uptake outer membrane protein [Chitinophaga niastensis]PSL47891.1 putative outer membrane starch-binding protein [Chitinophaga niastensis]
MKKIIYILAATFMGLGLQSCTKNIDLHPTDIIDTTRAFLTLSDVDKGVIGGYAGWSAENSMYVGAIMSDEVRWGKDNSGRNYGMLHKWSFSSSDGDAAGAWSSLYVVIDRVNHVLADIDSVPALNANQQATKKRLKGEALAIRAFAHFELFRWYSQDYTPSSLSVPVMLRSIVSTPSRNTVQEVLAQVNKDLADAKALIPATFKDISRITNIAVVAEQAKVALYSKDWKNAADYATAVINQVPLITIDKFPNLWTDQDSTEVLFWLKHTSQGDVTTLWTDNNGQVFFSPSFKLMALYDQTNDVRYNSYFYFGNWGGWAENWLVNKFSGQNSVNYFNNVKVLRVSEMYLIRAEALAELNDIPNGTKDLNTLRAQRISGYTDQTFASKDNLITAVMEERFKELFLEGNRYFDLRRRNLPINRAPEDVNPNNTGTGDIMQNLNPTDFRYILPVPQDEIFANKNIVQNKGYNN